MIERIKKMIERISERLEYSRCYSAMEDSGIAVFNMCSGTSTCCRNSCPFYVDIDDRRVSNEE